MDPSCSSSSSAVGSEAEGQEPLGDLREQRALQQRASHDV